MGENKYKTNHTLIQEKLFICFLAERRDLAQRLQSASLALTK